MEVKSILAKAWEAVQAAGIPEPLQAAAFERAVDLLVANHSPMNIAADKKGKATNDKERLPGSPLDRIARMLELDLDVVTGVYDEENGEPHLVVSSKKIDSKKQTGTRQLAILVAAARQSGLPEEATPVQVIRDVAEDYKRLDTKNFQSALRGLDHVFQIRGRGSSQTVKLSKPGWVAAADLVKQLGSTDT